MSHFICLLHSPSITLTFTSQVLKAEPYLKLSSGQEAYHYQLFVDKDDKVKHCSTYLQFLLVLCRILLPKKPSWFTIGLLLDVLLVYT